MIVTIGIKALNEAGHIAAAIESALAAIAPFGGEVIVADSGSTDGTVEIAARYPVRILQLANIAERCCGAGAQLAFQEARGTYFYLLDGDMTLDPGFLAAGIAFLDAHPGHAGVGGRVREMNVTNAEFQIRATKTEGSGHWGSGDVDRLDCGGLYRAAAVREAGYFADRNLHAFEEFELAARLASHDWKLARIDVPAVSHYGHIASGYALMWRRMRSGYTGATGEVLRAALGRRHLPVVLRRLTHIRKAVALIGWWVALAGLVAIGAPLSATLIWLLLPFVWFLIRWRTPGLVAYSFLAWNSTMLGLLTGLVRRRTPPGRPLAAIDLTP